MSADPCFDVLVVGGGPCGATAAHDLALRGHSVALLDRAGRIKPCGGAIPPILLEEFAVPESLLVARVTAARMVSPSDQHVHMPIDGGFVGMVDRDGFDEWLRARAASAGAVRITGSFVGLEHDAGEGEGGGKGKGVRVRYQSREGAQCELRARAVIGADGANSLVARAALPNQARPPFVFAYHEIIRSPAPATAATAATAATDFDGARCDVYYRGSLSPDFYGWVFPHGETTSVGVGSAEHGFSLRTAVAALRQGAGLEGSATVRREGAPIPLRPLDRWDNGRDVVLAGDAAGIVAPASGEGIYYAMLGGRLAADAVERFLATGDARALKLARRRFMKAHGRVFWILGIMQRFWYSSDRRRERFVSICRDRDVQHLTWQAYMYKKLVRAKPLAHVRIFFKDLAHLLGLAPT
jgi:geranylgeranyl reductase